MDKQFYIVPSTKSYYDTVTADSKEDALVTFATGMTSDMAAYFEATEEKPVHYPHGYKYPDGKFQCAMSIIVATMTNDKKSPYYIEHGLDDVNLTNLDAVAKLQETYDMLHAVDKKAHMKARKKFYKILRNITGFAFDDDKKPEKSDSDKNVHFCLDIDKEDDMTPIYCMLDGENIPYRVEGFGRLVVEKRHISKTIEIISHIGINIISYTQEPR